MPARNCHFDRPSITNLSGWVKLVASSLICDLQLQPLGTLSIRWNGTPAAGIALNVNSIYTFQSVDLSKLEISTTSGSAVACVIIGQAPAGG